MEILFSRCFEPNLNCLEELSKLPVVQSHRQSLAKDRQTLPMMYCSVRIVSQCFFFCSTLLRCDLLAKKVPGRAPYSQHIIIRNWTYLKRSKTEHLKSLRPKNANKQINKSQLDRRRRWQKLVGSKLVQGEDRKERVANRSFAGDRGAVNRGEPVARNP